MVRLRWALGLAPLAVLFLAAVSIETGKVESDIAARVEAVARDAGAKALVSGRDVSLVLTQQELSSAERLVVAILALLGVRSIAGVEYAADASSAPAPVAPQPPAIAPVPALPVVNPFTLSVERAASGLVASGYAPGAEERDVFMAALQTAAAPGVASGALELAGGLPEGVDFQQAAQFISVQASRLVSVRPGASGDHFSIAGETADSAGLAALRAAVGGVLPGGLKLASLDVQAQAPVASPFVFSAERAGAGMVLSGAVPSGEARALLLDVAAHGGRDVVDRLSLASGEPAGFVTFAAHGLSQFARLSSGRFTLNGASYALEGEAADFDSYDAVRQELRTAPQGVALTRIDVQPPLLRPYAFSVAREAAP